MYICCRSKYKNGCNLVLFKHVELNICVCSRVPPPQSYRPPKHCCEDVLKWLMVDIGHLGWFSALRMTSYNFISLTYFCTINSYNQI